MGHTAYFGSQNAFKLNPLTRFAMNRSVRVTKAGSSLSAYMVDFALQIMPTVLRDATHIMLRGVPTATTAGDLKRALLQADVKGVAGGEHAASKRISDSDIPSFFKWSYTTNTSGPQERRYSR